MKKALLAICLAAAALATPVQAATQTGIPITANAYPVIVMETDVAAVTAGSTDYGWVSGTISSLLASATVNVLFDLGPNWAQYPEVQVAIRPSGLSSGLTAVKFSSRDDASGALNANRQLGFEAGTTANGNSISSAPTTAGGTVTYNLRPMGRYLVVTATNADAINTLDAQAKITLAAYPR